jgi:hypothetical protein
MKILAFTFVLLFPLLTFAKEDLLDKSELVIKSERFGDVISLTAENLKDVFMGYKIALSQGLSIVKPLVVSGTQAGPNIRVSLKKCVTIVCNTVDLDADLSITKVEGRCDENFFLKADLQKSSYTLTEVYDYFYTTICANRSAQGAKVSLTSYAFRARTYSGGIVASTIRDILQIQITPILKSLQTELDKNIQIIDGI